MKKVQYINQDLLSGVCENAIITPRKRLNFNFHELQDRAQRMLNAIEPDSYVCPHRHLDPPKDEGFLVLQGKGAAIIFEDDGDIKEILLMDPAQKKWGVDIPAGIYHTVISLQPGTVFYEVKSGPYEALTDKGFAPWAPREGEKESKKYLQYLHQSVATAIEQDVWQID